MEHVERTEMPYSIYRFRDPRDQSVVYIGLTNDPDRRYKEHISKRGLLYPLAQELANEGMQLLFDVLETTIGIKSAFIIERNYIRQYQPPFNTIHNSAFVHAQKEIERHREEIAEAMELYHFTLREALIWHHEFSASEGDWWQYQLIEKTARVVQKRFTGKSTYTDSEILDIALEVSRFYEKWEPMWDQLWASMLRKAGVEGEVEG